MKRTTDNETDGNVEVMAASPTLPAGQTPSNDREPATVVCGPDGEVAVALVLSGADLDALGIDPDQVTEVLPVVSGGVLHLKSL